MGLTWLTNHFICKELYAPFVLDKDCDYEKDLRKKYNLVLKQAKAAGADKDSIAIINKYKKKVLELLRYYYRADIARSNTIIENLLRDIGNDPFAVAPLSNSYAFPGEHNKELQLFRCEAVKYSVSMGMKPSR